MGSETTDELSGTRMRDRQPGFDSTRDRDGERNDWTSGRTAGGDALRDGGDARSSWLVMSVTIRTAAGARVEVSRAVNMWGRVRESGTVTLSLRDREM